MHNSISNEMINPDLRDALDLVEEARNHFNNADNDRLDAAIYDLTAAELHLRATLKRARAGVPVDYNINPNAKTFTAAYPMPQLKQLRYRNDGTEDQAADASTTEESKGY